MRIVYKKLLKEIWQNYDWVEEFINDRIEEVFSHKKLSTEEVIYIFVDIFRAYYFLLDFFRMKSVFNYEV